MPHTITPQELAGAIEAGRAPAILDVRERSEFSEGRIPGAVNIPYWRLLVSSSSLPIAGDEPLLIYCGHGPRARIAQFALRLRGYRHTFLLPGHWAAWRRAGLPEERSEP